MNTREFVSYYRKLRKEKSNDEDISYEEARKEIEEFFDLISDIVAMDEEVKLKNKGNFILHKRKKRKIGTINTKEVKEIVPKDTIKFIPSKTITQE